MNADYLEGILETAEAELSTQASAINSALKFIECVKTKVLPDLDEALRHVSGRSAKNIMEARQAVLVAVSYVLEDSTFEPAVSAPEDVSAPAEPEAPGIPFGIYTVAFSLLHSMLTQDRLPNTLEELAKTRWGTDWKRQTFLAGSGQYPVIQDIVDPATSAIGKTVARTLQRIKQYLTGSIPPGHTPHPLLKQAANLVKRHGLEQVEATIKSWGITYPPTETG